MDLEALEHKGKALEELRYEFYQSKLSKKKQLDPGQPISSFFKGSEGEGSRINSNSPFSMFGDNTSPSGSTPASNSSGAFGSTPASNSSGPFGSTPASNSSGPFGSTPASNSSGPFGSTPASNSSGPFASTPASNSSAAFGSVFNAHTSGPARIFSFNTPTTTGTSSSTSSGIFADSKSSLFDSATDISSTSIVPSFGGLPSRGTRTDPSTSLFSFGGCMPSILAATDKTSTPSVSGTNIVRRSRTWSRRSRQTNTAFSYEVDTIRNKIPSSFGCLVKAPQSWFKEPSLEDQITCSVCLEVYAGGREPVVLPDCGHTFCRPCLLNVEREGDVKCPTCRKIHGYPSVSELPVLYSMLNLSEVYSKAKDSGTIIERCETHGDQLCLWCKECCEPLCGLCVFDKHYDRQQHTIERVLSVGDFDKNMVQKQASCFFQYSKRQQNRTMNELKVSIRRTVEMCQMSGNVWNKIKETKDILKNRKNIISLQSTNETLTEIQNAHEAVSLATKNLNEDLNFGLQDNETSPPTEVNDESDSSEVLENIDDQESESDEAEEQEAFKPEVDIWPLRCCAKSDDGRQMLLQVEENRLHVYALADIEDEARITLQVQLLELIIFQDKPEVFLELSIKGCCLGRIYIQLWGNMRRAKHFLALCLGTLGPSYRGAKFDHVSDLHKPGEVVHCMNYIDKNGLASEGLMENLEWDGEYRQLQKDGLLIASGFGQPEKDGCFGICTKAHPLKTFSCPFGMVVSGMETIHNIIQQNEVSDVTINEVGAVS